MAKQKQAESMDKLTSVIARESNGNIQITFTVPYELIQKAEDETLTEMSKDIEIPGFRRGKAPKERVREKVSENRLIEHALSHILPEALGDAVKANNLHLVVYPKFELISADKGKPWQIRGTSCELPNVTLGNYKEISGGALRAKAIIVPGAKGNEPKSQEQVREEKEQTVIRALLDSVKLDIPEILVREEADGRISSLLARIEKLGLTLEGYLSSIGKTPENLRADYAKQAKDAISLDLILSKVAEEEGITVNEKEVTAALNVSEASKTTNSGATEDQKRLLESILRRRKALDFLTNLG